jgi:hypothetical protein
LKVSGRKAVLIERLASSLNSILRNWGGTTLSFWLALALNIVTEKVNHINYTTARSLPTHSRDDSKKLFSPWNRINTITCYTYPVWLHGGTTSLLDTHSKWFKQQMV